MVYYDALVLLNSKVSFLLFHTQNQNQQINMRLINNKNVRSVRLKAVWKNRFRTHGK